MLLSNDINFRSGFNSPGAACSVNHQHYHLYYLRQRLYIETAELVRIAGHCFTLKDFPAKGFVFQLENEDITLLLRNVFTLISFLQQNEIAHNIFLTRGTSFQKPIEESYDTLRVFVWLRESNFGVKDDFGFNPACCEFSGHFLMKDETSYETLTETQVVNKLHEMTAPFFETFVSEIAKLFY